MASRQLKEAVTICTTGGSDPIFTNDAIPSIVHVIKAGRKLKEGNGSYLCS